jgi:hypothetical protein
MTDSGKMKKIIASLFIVCFLTITGCSGSTHSLTQTTGLAIIAKAISAMSLAKSYNLSTDLTENYTVFEKNNPQTTTDHWEWKSRRQIDISNKQMYLSMDIHETPDIQAYIFQEYLIGGLLSYEQSSPAVGGMTNPCTKTKLNEDNVLWSNYTQAASQIELLKTASNIDLVGTEQIDGTDCYIIHFNPSAIASTDWVLSQGGFPGPSVDWWFNTSPRVRQIYIKAFQNGSVLLWIDKNSNVIFRENISLNFEALLGNVLRSDIDLGNPDGQGTSLDVGFEKIIRDFSGDWNFSDYNQPVQIQLPQESSEAQNVGN